ncbi:MAG: rod shape-determining protein MreC [Candidatus Edwardsbacteria bacterium]
MRHFHFISLLQRGDFLLFLVTLLLSFSLFLLPMSVKLFLSDFSVKTLFSPFQKATLEFAETLKAKRENRELRRSVLELTFENSRLKQAERENEYLRALLEMKGKSRFSFLAAKIINRDPGKVISSFQIEWGKEKGVRCNLPVVSSVGLVGKVMEVKKETATVQTIFERHCRVSAKVIRSGVLGIICWQKGKSLSLEMVPVRSDLRLGDEVVSSGLGGIFPEGLKLGKIVGIEPKPTGFFEKIEVEPEIDLSQLEGVFLITGIKEESPQIISLSDSLEKSPLIPKEDFYFKPKDFIWKERIDSVIIPRRPISEEKARE